LDKEVYFFDLSKDPYLKTSTNDIPKLINVSSILESVRNILNTNKGERPYNPEFGCNLRQLLFEPLDQAVGYLIIEELKKCILSNEPRIEKLDIDLSIDEENQAYEITLFITPKSSNKQYQLKTVLNTIR